MMKVRKKDGELVECRFDKITDKLKKYTYGLNDDFIDIHAITQKVIPQMVDGMSTSEIDKLVAETAAGLTTLHPDYSILAARISVDSLHKNTKKRFSEVIKDLYKEELINEETYQAVKENAKELDNSINLSRDFDFDYFGFKTLEKAYLLKIKGKISETPQQMYMRVAVGIWGSNIEMVKKTYENLSLGYFTHATPTLFNAGTRKPQLSSCFLLQLKDDSIDGIFDTLKDAAKISKLAGGIGINMHNVRAKDSYIKGTGGYSNGIVPFLKVYNETARAVDQCFTAETKILTEEGYKQISNIIPNKDKVLTSDGSYHLVEKLKEYPEEEREFISIQSNEKENKVTDSHLYLVIKNCSHLNDNEIKERLEKNILHIEYIKAKDLTEKDILIMNESN